MENVIKYETAKLLEEVDFDETTKYSYYDFKEYYENIYSFSDRRNERPLGVRKVQKKTGLLLKNDDFRENVSKVYKAPSVYEVATWLREKHNIRVFPVQKMAGDYGFEIYIKNVKDPAGKPFERIQKYWTLHFNSFEEAMEEGVKEGVRILEIIQGENKN